MIGSDVPFFFSSGSAEVRGRGEIVEDVDLPLDYSVLIVFPGVPVSTRQVYASLKMDLTMSGEWDRFRVNKDITALADLLGLVENDLEESAIRCCPEVRKAREGLIARGFEHVSMSGSGSVVFALRPNRGATEREQTDAGKWGDWKVFVTQPIRLAGV
jgi:4-diphosphocytidyl-2-C-methyl-D-erythritol kinase